MTAGDAVVAALRAAGCVYAEDEACLLIAAATTPDELAAMVRARVAGRPLEHVLGWAEFCGLRVEVDPGVFVPRRRTQLLARLAAERARPAAVVVDLCCGSAAVGAVVAAAQRSIQLHATDIDAAAVACARRNLAGVADATVHQGDLFGPLPGALRGRVDILVANVPYVPSGEIGLLPAEARLHEPRVALDGGADGLDVLRRVVVAAPAWLAAGAHLLSEVSEDQAPAALALLAGVGLSARVARDRGLAATVVIGAV